MKLKKLVPLISLALAVTVTGCNLEGSSNPNSAGGTTDNGSGSTGGGSTDGGSNGGGETTTDYVEAVDYSQITPTTIAKDESSLISAISEASEGDVIGLDSSYNFSTLNALTIDKKLTLVSVDGEGNVLDPKTSDEQATISGSGCIFLSATSSGTQLLNLAFTNDQIGADSACVLSGSTGRSGVIAIGETESGAVILDNLNFDAVNIVDQDADLNNKSSWIYADGQFELTNSKFINLASNLENNAIYTSCSKGASRAGSVISSTVFSINGGSTSQTSAIKIGESSSGVIKDNENTKACNFNLTNNVFINYITLNDTDISDTSKRPIAIWSYESALTTNTNNSLQ